MKKHERQVYNQKSRVQFAGIKDELNSADWLEILEQSCGLCFYCGADVGIDFLTLDHKMPLKNQGRHHKSNIVAACSRCNCLKNDQTEFQPNSIPFLERHSRVFTKKQLVERLQIRITLLNRPLYLLGLRPAGVCNKDKRTVLFDENSLHLLLAYFEDKRELNEN